MRNLNIITEATLTVEVELMNQTHLPSADVVAGVIFFVLLLL